MLLDIDKYQAIDFDPGENNGPIDPSSLAIVLTGLYGGNGDLMAAINLAENIQHYTDKEVTFVYSSKAVAPVLKTLFPEGIGNGIQARYIPDRTELAHFLSRQKIAIHTPIAATLNLNNPLNPRLDTPRPSLETVLQPSKINIYLEEYNTARDRIALPDDIHSGTTYRDSRGNWHLPFKTGFTDGSLGIHIDKRLADAAPPKRTLDERRELLRACEIPDHLVSDEELRAGQLGFAYYNVRDTFDGHRNFRTGWIDPLLQHVNPVLWWMDGFNKGIPPITILNFSELPRDDDRLPFPFDESRVRQTKIVNGQVTSNGKKEANVHVIYIGPKKHELCTRAMAQSDLPLYVTGDLSLAEAIALRKPFLYQSCGWKSGVTYGWRSLAEEVLSYEEAVHIRSIFGVDKVDEKDYAFYLEVEKAYREFLDGSMDPNVYPLNQPIVKDIIDRSFGVDPESVLGKLRATILFSHKRGGIYDERTYANIFKDNTRSAVISFHDYLIKNHNLAKNLGDLIADLDQQIPVELQSSNHTFQMQLHEFIKRTSRWFSSFGQYVG